MVITWFDPTHAQLRAHASVFTYLARAEPRHVLRELHDSLLCPICGEIVDKPQTLTTCMAYVLAHLLQHELLILLSEGA